MLPCLLSGLPDDPLVDAEIWRYNLVLGTPTQGNTTAQPFDLTGSDLAIVMRVVSNWQVVATFSTLSAWPGRDGVITLTDPVNGAISLASDPWIRTYRVPVFGGGVGPSPVMVQGDVLRRLSADPTARPEYLGFIRFPLRASTTQWPVPAS